MMNLINRVVKELEEAKEIRQGLTENNEVRRGLVYATRK